MFKKFFKTLFDSEEDAYLEEILALREPRRTQELVDLFETYFEIDYFKRAIKVAMNLAEPQRTDLLKRVLEKQIEKKHYFGQRKTEKLILKLFKKK